jgi:predicted ATPase
LSLRSLDFRDTPARDLAKYKYSCGMLCEDTPFDARVWCFMTEATLSAARYNGPVVVAVTGAQGVGKSTFCRNLYLTLCDLYGVASTSLIDGLGDKIKAAGFAVGKTADSESVAAIFSEHLRRERTITSDIAILDRCAIDALAYVRTLGVNTPIEAEMYAEVARAMSRGWTSVVHLQLSNTFLSSSATHEDAELRFRISQAVPAIIEELGLAALSVDAAASDSLDRVVKAVRRECDRLSAGHALGLFVRS